MSKKLLLLLFIFTGYLFASTPEKVRKQIENILDELPAGTTPAILIYNPLTQDTIFSINHTKSMIPASNTKLFTTATALNLLGGDFTLSTKIMSDDVDLSDGIVNGNLYIKGYGNSTFTEDDLIQLVNQLKMMDVERVTGNIVGDDTYFDDIYTRDDWITNEKANVELPPISALVIDRNTYYTYKRRRRYKHYIENPPLYAAELLKEKLLARDIFVRGSSTTGITPANAIDVVESTITLRELIARINKHSDNFLAECLFKTIGAEASGKQGNSFYSTQTILTFIEDNAIYAEGTAVVDGSGISRFNQITAGAIVGLLEKMYFDLPNFDDYYNSFSIAGVDGTLERRMRNTFAENNFRGKTGTLNGVSSLSGYLTTKSDDDLILCIFFEFERGRWSYYRDVQDRIVEVVAELE